MKKRYESPVLEITAFAVEDVITISIGGDTTNEIGVLYQNLA